MLRFEAAMKYPGEPPKGFDNGEEKQEEMENFP